MHLMDIVMGVLELVGARGDPSRQLNSTTSETTQAIIDHVPPNAEESSNRAHLFIFEDMEL